jgi:hypothetical protein
MQCLINFCVLFPQWFVTHEPFLFPHPSMDYDRMIAPNHRLYLTAQSCSSDYMLPTVCAYSTTAGGWFFFGMKPSLDTRFCVFLNGL